MRNPVLTLCFAASLACGTASAASIDLQWDANPFNPAHSSDDINISTPRVWNGIYPDRYHGVASNLVGITAADLIDGANGSIFTYCYELTEVFSGNQTVQYTINYSGVNAATLDFLGAVNAVLASADPYGWLYPLGSHTFGSTTLSAATIAEAIQIGIWETRYDGASWNLTAGTFQATGIDPLTTQVALDAFYNQIATTPALSAQYAVTLENVGRPGAQDQITGLRSVSQQQVPEPGSLSLLLLASALAAGTLRTRRA